MYLIGQSGNSSRVSCGIDQGRGIDGIVEVEPDYFNPLVELMRGERPAQQDGSLAPTREATHA